MSKDVKKWHVEPGCDGYRVIPEGSDFPVAERIGDLCDADLIAAAPNLLDALQRIVAWDDSGCDMSMNSIETARAAIAKATGG